MLFRNSLVVFLVTQITACLSVCCLEKDAYFEDLHSVLSWYRTLTYFAVLALTFVFGFLILLLSVVENRSNECEVLGL